jgi:putative tricarboxylic transport membrane protein
MGMRRLVSTSNRDYHGGALMIAIGLGAIIQGRQYPIGTLSRMGPGFFPVALGAILAFTGLAILVSARFAARKAEESSLPPEWRGWFCIGLSIVAFVVLGRYGGLVPATFAIVFISALADRENTILAATVLALTTVAICIVVFWWALQLNFALFGWG